MNWIDNMIENVGLNSKFIKRVGLFLFALPTGWDLAKMGLYGLIERGYIVIHIPGLLFMATGLVVIWFAERIRKWLVD